jgi:predicted small lipoprotein YifL
VDLRSLSAAAIVLLVSTGCGQKGPVYLRDAPPPGVKPAKVEPYKPIPYPKDPERGEATEK